MKSTISFDEFKLNSDGMIPDKSTAPSTSVSSIGSRKFPKRRIPFLSPIAVRFEEEE